MASFKDQLVNQCHAIWNFTASTATKVYRSIVSNEGVQEKVEKTKEFYQNHKQLCIGAGIALVAVVLITRKYKKNRQEKIKQQGLRQRTGKVEEELDDKQERKKSQIVVPPASSKKFMDEEDVEFFPDQPSTDIIQREKNQRRRHRNELNSSSDDEREDRIFFEMYNTYRKTEEDQ